MTKLKVDIRREDSCRFPRWGKRRVKRMMYRRVNELTWSRGHVAQSEVACCKRTKFECEGIVELANSSVYATPCRKLVAILFQPIPFKAHSDLDIDPYVHARNNVVVHLRSVELR
jgi:hypothetical protein